MKKFTQKLTLISLAITLIAFVLFRWIIPNFYLPVFPFLLLFFYCSTLAIHCYQLKLIESDIGKFTRSNMVLTILRLFIYSLFTIAYMLYDRENARTFVAAIFILYIIYTGIEIYEASQLIRKFRS